MDAPYLSIVIASHNAGAVVADCLAALMAQVDSEAAEVIIADSSSDGTAELVRERFPDVHLLHFSERLTIPQLRGAAIAAAGGEIIAILDPYCLVSDGWLARLRGIHEERAEQVIGGAVELDGAGHQSLVTWATFLSEYDAFVPPLGAGPAGELTGNNLAYKRQALGDVEALKRAGFWKTSFNKELQANCHQLWADPSLLVRLRKTIPFGEFLRSRYHHGRCFGAMRVAGDRRLERWLRAFSVPLLPALGLFRQARRLWPKSRYRARFVMASPLLLLFHVSWAWGELWGYLRGPGCSCSKLFY